MTILLSPPAYEVALEKTRSRCWKLAGTCIVLCIAFYAMQEGWTDASRKVLGAGFAAACLAIATFFMRTSDVDTASPRRAYRHVMRWSIGFAVAAAVIAFAAHDQIWRRPGTMPNAVSEAAWGAFGLFAFLIVFYAIKAYRKKRRYDR